MAINANQKILLDLLVRAEKLMRDNDIKFFLFGGSTIGALRHNGFIPWDDDIDIIIDAENFYKLKDLFKDGPVAGMDMVYFHNDPYWYRAYAMLVNLDDTCYTRPCLYTTGKNAGTRIDTMIMDYIPHERLEEYKHDLMLYQEVLGDSVLIDEKIYNIKDEYYALRKRMDEIGRLAMEKELRKKLESYSTPDSDELVVRYSTRAIRHYAIDTLYEPLYHDFEGYPMPIPGKPELQLRQQYGYNWYMVPNEDRKVHRFFHNYDICGRNYHEDIVRFYDRDELQNAARLDKYARIEKQKEVWENREIRANMVVQRDLLRTDIENREEEFEKLAKEQSYGEIYSRLQPLTSRTAYFAMVEPEHINIPESIIREWLKAGVYCGKYYGTLKLIAALGLSEDEKYAAEIELAEKTASLAEAYQDRDHELMKERRKAFSDEEAALVPECIFADFALAAAGKDDSSARSHLIDICQAYLEKVPENYEVQKVLADLYYEGGRSEEAMEIYHEVHSNTANGLDVLDIETRFGFEPRYVAEEVEDEINRVVRDLL